MSPKGDRAKRLAKKRERKKNKRKDKEAGTGIIAGGGLLPAIIPASPMVPRPSRPPTRFSVPMGPALEVLGPMVRAVWGIPKSLAAQLAIEGKPVPAPVVGHLLVDTGASRTCIAESAAQQLGLKPIDVCFSHGAHGKQQAFVYMATFGMGIADGHTNASLHIERELAVQGIPQLEESFGQFGATDDTGAPVKVIGLLGRDFLRFCRVTYDGPKGTFEIDLDLNQISAATR